MEDSTIRRLVACPSGASLLSVDDARTLTVYRVADAGGLSVETTIAVPEPAADAAWCPFMTADDNRCVVATSIEGPVRMIDTSDGEVRSAYHVLNTMGEVCGAQTVAWSVHHPERIVAGYGRQTECVLALFDIHRQGNDAASVIPMAASRCAGFSNAAGPIVGALCELAPSLVAAGMLNGGGIELFDTRSLCPAGAIPQAHRAGITHLLPLAEGRFVSVPRSPDAQVRVWDMRNIGKPLAIIERPSCKSHARQSAALVGGRLLLSSDSGLLAAPFDSLPTSASALAAFEIGTLPSQALPAAPVEGAPDCVGPIAAVAGGRALAAAVGLRYNRRLKRQRGPAERTQAQAASLDIYGDAADEARRLSVVAAQRGLEACSDSDAEVTGSGHSTHGRLRLIPLS